jgi:hypothetical protein
MSIFLLIIWLLVGVFVGQRYKVLVLIPTMALAVTVTLAPTHFQTVWQIFSEVLLTTTTLQVGYLIGVGIRYLMAVNRMPGAFLADTTSSRPAAN